MMKLWLTVLLSLVLIPTLLCAQAASDQSSNPNRIVVPLSHPSQPAQVKLRCLSGGISVQGYAGNQVIVEGLEEHPQPSPRPHPAPEETEGMRRLATGGLSADEDNNVVTIRPGLTSGNLHLQVPAGSSLMLKTLSGNVQVKGVSGDLDIESMSGGITLDQVGGSIIAHAISGPITAGVARLDTSKPSSFSTMNGRIDLTLPARVRANLTIRTDDGDVYLDRGFDFKELPGPTGGTTELGSHHTTKFIDAIRGTINGGGAEIDIRSFNGAILIHKAK